MADQAGMDSRVKRLEDKVQALRAKLEATNRLHRDLAIATMGDSPETAFLLERLNEYTVESWE